MITSDHSPSEPTLKAGEFGDAWGGIAGCQTTLTLLLTEGHHERALALETVARLTSTGAAERFAHAGQGPDRARRRRRPRARRPQRPSTRCTREDLEYRHRISPYIGRRLRARVTTTLLRGAAAHPERQAQPRLLTPHAFAPEPERTLA